MPQPPEPTFGGPYHQPTISHSGRRLTIGSDSEPDTGDAVDSAKSTRRFLFSGRYIHREGSQQPEFDQQHSQLYEQRKGQSLTLCVVLCCVVLCVYMCVCTCI